MDGHQLAGAGVRKGRRSAASTALNTAVLGPKPQRQAQYGRRGEGRVLRQHVDGVLEVLVPAIEEPHVATSVRVIPRNLVHRANRASGPKTPDHAGERPRLPGSSPDKRRCVDCSDDELSAHRDRPDVQRHGNERLSQVATGESRATLEPLRQQRHDTAREGPTEFLDSRPLGRCTSLQYRRLGDDVRRRDRDLGVVGIRP